MHHLKRAIRRLLAALLYRSGLLWVLAARRLRERAVVLMYHRVLPATADTCSHAAIIVSPQAFERQMRFLKRHFRPVPLPEFERRLDARAFAPGTVLVTFDDGWQDNYSYALPILSQHGVPAVVFIATDYVGTTKTFWQEALARLLLEAWRRPGTEDPVFAELGAPGIAALDGARAKAAIFRIVSRAKQDDPARIQRLIARLEAARPASDATNGARHDDRFLDWEEARALADGGVMNIGSHAHTHTPLPPLGIAGAKREWERSVQEFLRKGLAAPAACAYPNGDVDDATVRAARDAGFRIGFATSKGFVRTDSDRMRVNRVNVSEQNATTDAEFLCLMLRIL